MSAPTPVPMAGFLNLDKPSGITSREAVDLVIRALRGRSRRKVKAGHAGTLDPLASGVLVVALGSGTKLIEYVQRMPKVYRTVVRLGARSDTLDADGQITVFEHATPPDLNAIQAALRTQVGTIAQMPPQYSALKVGGQRAYDLARSGREVALEARPVVVERIDILSYAWPSLELEIACGSGTYIRSIARDVGEALSCGGLVEILVRTRIGPFRIEEAIDPRGLSDLDFGDHLRPMADAVVDLPTVRLTAEQLVAVARGQTLDVSRVAGNPASPGREIALLTSDGELAALAEITSGGRRIQPRKVLLGDGSSS